MLEGLATWVLNTYLGQYLENLNTDQLSIGLLKGEVELENVPLRKDALKHLDMSLEVRAGFVGKVRLQIPVVRLRSEPWMIAFEQLYLVAGPIDLDESIKLLNLNVKIISEICNYYSMTREAEESAGLARKISQLDNIEAIWRSEQESLGPDSSYGTSYSSWLSVGTSFITNIIENIQLKIQDVHIRYEDDKSKPGELFACGLTIESLTVQSSDEHWIPKFVYTTEKSISYKLLELKNFGVYWDSSTTIYSSKSLGELATLMVPSINGGDHDYILEPVSASACLKRNLNASPLRSRNSPRFTCDIKLEKFPLSLTDIQYNQMISSLRFYERLETARPYRKWRPKCKTVQNNAKEWWQYAMQCHVDKIHRKYKGRNWDFAFSRAKAMRKYVNIYKEHLRNPIKTTSDMQKLKSEIEQELNFEELRVLREICMEKVSKELLVNQKERTESNTTDSNLGPPPEPGGVGEGVLQSWFPGWGGWYTSTVEEPKTYESTESPVASPEIEPSQEKPKVSQLEEEILYVLSDSIENNTFTKRDAVFAQLSFSLKKGNVVLSVQKNENEMESLPKSKDTIPLFELEFYNVKLAFESRPRNQSFSFDVELGTMSLKDQASNKNLFNLLIVTEGTSFPLLISQQRDSFNSQLKMGRGITPSAMYARLTSMISSVSRLSPNATTTPLAPNISQGPLFSLSYEKKPVRTMKSDHKLVINSQALDIVYNQRAFETICDYFFPASLRQEENELLNAWTKSAILKYEELKEQTKEEIKKNWSSVIQGIMTVERKRWDIELDISAPQIIIPENFEDPNATLVILDFGKLIFCTAQQNVGSESQNKISNSDDEDSFATPCSTPEEFHVKEEIEKTGQFDLKLCDMQVLVAKVKDNWRFAYQKGTGPMHVIDRFNINLHLERRILEVLPDNSSSGDSQWPHLVLSGSLPQLVVHINEQKVNAIRNICSTHLWTASTDQSDSGKRYGKDMKKNDISPKASFIPRSATLTTIVDKESFDESYKDTQSDSKLIVMQFNVDKLSIELQSRGRSVAELQVTGVRSQMSKRPTDISASLSVHSLLLVDALQTFGSDFELLVASHKHISMDSVSGSLLDSEPCSPTSPASPDASLPGKPTSPVALSHALNSLACNRASSPPISDRGLMRSPTGVVSPTFGHPLSSIDGSKDSEALIKIEVTYIAGLPSTHDDPNGSTYIFSSVQFNALDIIANQETVVELVGFIHQLFSPQSTVPYKPADTFRQQSYCPTGETDNTPTATTPVDKGKAFYGSFAGLYSPRETTNRSSSSQRAEISFDFHKLTILLLRGTLKDKEMIGKKVGTAVLSHAKIEASVVNDILTCEGSLGGFQIRDVTPEGSKHQCIVSVGHDPIVERSQDLVSRIHSGVYQSFAETKQSFKQRAFSFKVVRPLVLLSTSERVYKKPSSREHLDTDEEEVHKVNKICVQLHLASVCYTHSPQFLVELKSCAKEFKQYMAQLASSIKQAATEVAIGLVSKRIESFTTLSGSGVAVRDSSPRHLNYLRNQNFSKSTDTLVFPQPPPASTLDSTSLSPTHGVAPDLPFNAEVNVVLETPIVVLPESPNSPNVLVAHLGQISIHNKDPELIENGVESMDFFPIKTALFEIGVKDMSLFCLNVDERLRSRDIIFHPLSSTIMNAEELYSCKEHGVPILHSTSLELVLKQTRDSEMLTEFEAGLIFPSDIYVDSHPLTSPDSFTLDGGFITSPKVSVSRHQYLLMCQVISNLSLDSTSNSKLDMKWKKTTTVDEREKSSTEGFSVRREHSSLSKEHVPIKGVFTVPSLYVELRGDVGQEERPLVNLVLTEISAVYDVSEPFKSNTQITLRSLTMEDLQSSDSHSNPQFLVKSENVDLRTPPPHFGKSMPLDIPIGTSSSSYSDSQFLSTSCPEAWVGDHIPIPSASLPAKLEMEKPFYKALKKPIEKIKRNSIGVFTKQDSFVGASLHPGECPCTPPPSPSAGTRESVSGQLSKDGALVNISIFTVDPKSPDFMNKYDGNSRFVDIDLSSLVTVINLESWVMVFDFFRSPSEGISKETANSSEILDEYTSYDVKSNEEQNMVMEVQVRSLTLVLNKSEGEMAKFAVNQVSVRSVGSAGDLTLNGRLGSLSLIDCTPHGSHYREKFLTVGTEAMTFQLFRYSEEDPNLQRNCDIRLKLKMSSIMYVHSHRFLQELTQFFLQFLFLRDKLSDWRAVTEKPHGTRVSLDISAGSPVIFIPMWNQSDEVLAVDLGSLSVSNKFLWSGAPNTISKMRREDLFDRLASSSQGQFRSRSGSLRSRSRSGSRRFCENRTTSSEETQPSRGQRCLLDVMQVALVNMDLFKSQRMVKSSKIKLKGDKKEVEENIWDFGSFAIVRKGSSVLKEKCALKVQVERNLDADISRIVPDFSIHGVLTKIHATVDVSYYKLIRGLLAHNLGEPVPEMKLQTVFLSLQQAPKPQRKEPLSIYLVNVKSDAIAALIFFPALIKKPFMITFFTSCQNNLTSEVTTLCFYMSTKSGFEYLTSMLLYSASHVWTILSIHFDLDDVIVETELTNEDDNEHEVGNDFEKHRSSNLKDSIQKTPFSRINFIKSKLLYERSSDSSKDIDLVSQEILISDTRFDSCPVNKRSNVFSHILAPAQDKNLKNENPLQAEVHYRSTSDLTQFTILLNNMRLMGILDWWKIAQYFIQSSPPDPPGWESMDFIFNAVKEESENSFNAIGGGLFTTVNKANPRKLNPMVESTGLMTKHLLISDDYKVPFELKLNITDSEVVIVENSSEWDSSAVILKTTAVVSYRPHFQERPISCNLNQCELFSCILGFEEETALSIIDPVTVNIEVNDHASKNSAVNITNIAMRSQHTVEISLHQLNIRLSYHDMKMFQRILESLPRQNMEATTRKNSYTIKNSQEATTQKEPANFTAQVEKLCVLGFSQENCLKALKACEGKLDEAALWLTQNVQPEIIEEKPSESKSNIENALNLHGFEDYEWKGSCNCTLSIDYYNRALSGWEPFIEPWKSLERSESILGEVTEENWRKVSSGENVSFAFEERAGKQRHGHSHIVKRHRLLVRVGNWNPVGPVTVDKVGVFFRLGLYQASIKSAQMPSVRIVFDIKMDGSARKLIRVRSALLLTNRLPHTVELKLDNTAFKLGGFYVHIKRDNYPVDEVSPRPRSPIDMEQQMKLNWIFTMRSNRRARKGESKVLKETFISSVDPEEEVEFSFWTDSFRPSSVVSVRSSKCPFETSVKLTDSSGRPVHLQVKAYIKYGNAVKMRVSAFFWIINKTGLPILVKQEGTNVEAAGQDSEHEVARCATPLLFSFSDLEASPTLVARVGKHLHSNAVPFFCKKIPLSQNTCVRRRLHVGQDHRPAFVYEIGIDVRTGRGKFRDTFMVTLSPRFHLENRSSHELLISQKCFTSPSHVDFVGQSTWLRAIPGCWLPFHWPRLDKDPLLCVRLCDLPESHWSGGFLIDKPDSFNINIRDTNGFSHFLRVEILMSEATFFVVFNDPHLLPPPFRIDNFSLVSITYYQTGTREEHLRTSVRPRYSTSYAWDEVTFPPHITCVAPGGTSATYNLNTLGEGAQLLYENFIYIAFTGTFKAAPENNSEECTSERSPLVHTDYDGLQLVLDVSEGTRVQLARKEIGRRSQLWRMTTKRMLQHEGSSPPYDPTSKKPRNDSNILVILITKNILPSWNSEYTPLVLRKPDVRRSLTQTWRFTEDGRLCCEHPNMYVQAKDGFLGLASGNDVVLGPPQIICYGTMPNGIPVEQAISRQRLRPGSGRLAVKVVIDGPTRVLQIIDVQNKSSPQVARTDTGDLVYINENKVTSTSSLMTGGKENTKQANSAGANEALLEEFQLQVLLKDGIGISVVSYPEELLYAMFSDIVFECVSSSSHRNFDCSVRGIQVDNQLPKAQCPVVFFVSPQSKN
ncbi:Vacuolar protein sorting-associated protein 13D [Armadillidium nasatum]|uniref:Vacuolar protein sorting-associated protein 13D n=1 Tax=Armadillidium nasatum TaxID=96803 RepID=A0A5N5T5X4_9CRUS|nr:Vacuolar protein sorting-associated protein 13D [Armadillidium nasatum]